MYKRDKFIYLWSNATIVTYSSTTMVKRMLARSRMSIFCIGFNLMVMAGIFYTMLGIKRIDLYI